MNNSVVEFKEINGIKHFKAKDFSAFYDDKEIFVKPTKYPPGGEPCFVNFKKKIPAVVYEKYPFDRVDFNDYNPNHINEDWECFSQWSKCKKYCILCWIIL